MAKVIFDAKKALESMSRLAEGLADQSQLFKNIADYELKDTLLRFKKGVKPDGSKWPDPYTIRRGDGLGTKDVNRSTGEAWDDESARAFYFASRMTSAPKGWHIFDPTKDKVMRDTGNLMNSISREYGKSYAVVGTNVEYAEKLQDGRFPFIGMTKKTNKNINNSVKAYLKGLLK